MEIDLYRAGGMERGGDASMFARSRRADAAASPAPEISGLEQRRGRLSAVGYRTLNDSSTSSVTICFVSRISPGKPTDRVALSTSYHDDAMETLRGQRG